MKALYIMNEPIYATAFDKSAKEKIAALLGSEPAFFTGQQIVDDPSPLFDCEVILASYGMCPMDAEFLRHAPNLKAVFCAVGSIKALTSPEFWQRDIIITSAAAENGIAVAEFTFAQIILSLKRFFFHHRNYTENRDATVHPLAGTYKSRVGIISYGLIARHVCKLLKQTAVELVIWSPELDEKSAAAEGLRFAPLDEVFKSCDVVSLHTPILPETRGMIKCEHFMSMKPNASFINTARGAVIDEEGMIKALTARPDITALLDVIEDRALPGNPLFDMPNIVLSPHIAGAIGPEKARMGALAAEELRRFLNGEPPLYRVENKDLGFIA